jgi:hypothetical protein
MFVPIGSNSGEGYQTQRSLRFRASASAFLSRTPGGAGNLQTWTWSGWVKRGTLGTDATIFGTGETGAFSGYGVTNLRFIAANTIRFLHTRPDTGGANIQFDTTAVFRDPSAWYHVVIAIDTTQATNTNGVKLWVNNVLQAGTFAAYVQNSTTVWNNSAAPNFIGRLGTITPSLYLGDHLSDVYFVDGKALTPAAFGEFDTTVTTYWKPKSPAQVRAAVAVGGGARNGFGTNGFYLPFSDPTSLTTLTYDRSQSDTDTTGNNWTASNVSLTAGATYDSMLDVPLGGGGQERGNYCTLNPLVPSAANITNANLSSGTTPVRSAFDCSLFNSQWEVTAGASAVTAGVITEAGTANTTTVTANKTFAFRLSTAGALDYKNITDAGSWTSITTGLSGTRFPYGTGAAASWNFGQRPLAEAVTAGYYTLHTGNLTNTTVVTSGSYTGNLSADGPCIWCNGIPETLTINGNAVTWGTHADKLATGFKLRTSSSSYNSSGTNTWTATYLSPSSKSAFKYQNAKGNP